MSDAVVVGGRLVGLVAAWLLAERDLDVTLVEAGAPGAPDRVHGQVLPPRAELRGLWAESLRLYDRLAEHGDFGWDVEPVGALVPAWTEAEAAAQAGREGEVLDPAAVLEREPGLAPCAGGLWVAEGRGVRPDLVIDALVRVVRHSGVRLRAGVSAEGVSRTPRPVAGAPG